MASVTARGASWRVQGRDRTGRMRGVTFPDRADADAFGEMVDRVGWDAARATLGGDPVVKVEPLSLDRLRLLIVESDSENWHTVDLWGGKRAVYEPDVSIAVEWERDAEAMRDERRREVSFECYPGLTRELSIGKVLVHGQPIVQTPLFTVKQTWRKRDSYLFVPWAVLNRRKWTADAFDFELARIINLVSWRSGYEAYMESCQVRPRRQG